MEERNEIYLWALSLFSRIQNTPETWREVRRQYKIDVNRELVRSWIRDRRSPSRRFLGRVIAGPSADLSYVIMAAKGDGCSGRRSNGRKGFLYNIEFKVKDFDFASRFALSASLALNRETSYKVLRDRYGFCHVIIHSKALYELLERIPSSPSHCRKYLAKTHAIARMGIRGFLTRRAGRVFRLTIEESSSQKSKRAILTLK